MKELILSKESKKALLNGDSMFLVPISNFLEYTNELKQYQEKYSQYKIGDVVCFKTSFIDWTPIEFIIKDIKVLRIKNLSMKQWNNLGTCLFDSKDWYNKQYKNYNENQYVFLYEVERIK